MEKSNSSNPDSAAVESWLTTVGWEADNIDCLDGDVSARGGNTEVSDELECLHGSTGQFHPGEATDLTNVDVPAPMATRCDSALKLPEKLLFIVVKYGSQSARKRQKMERQKQK